MSENIFNNMPRENVESGTEATAQNKLPAQDWNRVVFEVNNTIKDAGITPQVFEDNEDLSVQQSQAIMHNALCADFFSDYTTDPNNLILDNNGTFQRPTRYINGMKISFVANYSNTYETCSVNVCGLGSKAIYSDKLRTGLPYNSIKKNQINNIIYLSELDAFLLLRSGNNFMQKIGELIISTIPFDDDKLHLANGDFLPADGQYLDFYKFMKEKHDSGKYNNIFCSEVEYNASISAKGRCAKYVFSEGFGVRLPTINGIVEGTTNVNELGELTEESLPQHKHYINNNIRGGSYSAPQDGTLVNSSNHMSNNDYFLCGSTAVEANSFLSSRANNTVYQDNAKVHPETVKQFFYVVVGTYIDDNIPVDKLNLKANRNLDNLQTILVEEDTDVDTIKTSGNYEFLLGAHTNTPFSTETSAFGMLVFTNSEYVYQYVWGYDNSSYHRYYNPIEELWGDWKNIDMGGTGGANLPLLTPQFFDHTLNDASWLRSDTFSWQNGNIYVAVYNKLVEENSTRLTPHTVYIWNTTYVSDPSTNLFTYNANPVTGDKIYYTNYPHSSTQIIEVGFVESLADGVLTITKYDGSYAALIRCTSETSIPGTTQLTTTMYTDNATYETYGDITIAVYISPNGYKIIDQGQESNVAALYSQEGIAWYYVLDTENHRFKLPRSNWNFVGYRNGLVGDYINESLPNVTGSYPLGLASESLSKYSGAFFSDNSTSIGGTSKLAAPSSGSYSYASEFDASHSSSTYQDNAPVQQRATQMYLYFYVGNTIRNIEEVDVGALTEAINKKADTGYIGQILAIPCSENYVPNGCLPCDGAEYSSAQFNDLWSNYLTATSPLLQTCTYTEYQTSVTNNGFCEKFAVDTDDNKFRVPTLNNVMYQNTDTTLPVVGNGKTISVTDGITNVGLYISSNTNPVASRPGLYGTDVGTNDTGTGFYMHNKSIGFSEDEATSCLIAKNKTTTNVKYFVIVANGEINQSQMDWAAWATGLNGKANTDLNNVASNIDYVIESGSNDSGNYRKYRSGLIEQWGTTTGTGSYGTSTINLPVPYTESYNIIVSGNVENSFFTNTSQSSVRGTTSWTGFATKTLTSFQVNTYLNIDWRTRGK